MQMVSDKRGWVVFSVFPLNINSWTKYNFLESGLMQEFHKDSYTDTLIFFSDTFFFADTLIFWIVYTLISCYFLFKSGIADFFQIHFFADTLISWIAEYKDVSSANSLTLDNKLLDKSLIEIRKNNRPNMNPCGTPALTLAQVDTWLLRRTFCFLLPKKSLKRYNKLPEMLFCSSLKIRYF